MHYSIVFTGKIREGATLSETRHNLAEMFKIGDQAVLDKVFSGKTVILKKGLGEDEARKQEMILYMAGAVCEVRNNAPPPPPPAPVAEAPPPSPASPPPPVAFHAGAAAAQPTPPPPAPPGARPAGLSLRPDDAATRNEVPVPAALRGQSRDTEAEERAVERAGKVMVTNHGRDGEGLLDPMIAPWDPAFIPDGVKGLSWAGLFAPFLWGTFNGLRFSFVPLLGVRLLRHFVPVWAWGVFSLALGLFYLVKGRELAWENKQWRNGEHFNRVQRYWSIGSVGVLVLWVGTLFWLGVKEAHANQLVQAATALAEAEVAVERAADPPAKAAAVEARAKARARMLAATDDAQTRERERQTFIEQDREEAAAAAEEQPGTGTDPQPAPQ